MIFNKFVCDFSWHWTSSNTVVVPDFAMKGLDTYKFSHFLLKCFLVHVFKLWKLCCIYFLFCVNIAKHNSHTVNNHIDANILVKVFIYLFIFLIGKWTCDHLTNWLIVNGIQVQMKDGLYLLTKLYR